MKQAHYYSKLFLLNSSEFSCPLVDAARMKSKLKDLRASVRSHQQLCRTFRNVESIALFTTLGADVATTWKILRRARL